MLSTSIRDTITNKEAPPSPPALPQIPPVGAVVQQGQDLAQQIFGETADVLERVITGAEQVTVETVNRGRDVLNVIREETADILGDVFKDLEQRANLLTKISIEPDALLTALAQGMASAADLVAGSRSTDLIVTDGKIFTEFYVKLPPPLATGAFARIEVNLKSKEFMRLSAGSNATDGPG